MTTEEIRIARHFNQLTLSVHTLTTLIPWELLFSAFLTLDLLIWTQTRVCLLFVSLSRCSHRGLFYWPCRHPFQECDWLHFHLRAVSETMTWYTSNFGARSVCHTEVLLRNENEKSPKRRCLHTFNMIYSSDQPSASVPKQLFSLLSFRIYFSKGCLYIVEMSSYIWPFIVGQYFTTN